MTALALVVSVVALVVSVVALSLAYVVMRQSGDVVTTLREHRRAHVIAFGHADPKLDRRQVNVGPPRSTGERRGATRYTPPSERLAPRPPDTRGAVDPEPFAPFDTRGARVAVDQQDNLPTGELEQQDVPTSLMQSMPPLVGPRAPRRREDPERDGRTDEP